MKTIYLMRHGHSPSTSEAGVRLDALRPLSDRGRSDATRVAKEILRRGGKPTMILHSPLLRAVQTAENAAAALSLKPRVCPALDNTWPPDQALAELKSSAKGMMELLAIGHQPQIGEIVSQLIDGVFEIRPAGIVAIALDPTPKLLWAVNADEL
jgi:phosphohistidine phosphatase